MNYVIVTCLVGTIGLVAFGPPGIGVLLAMAPLPCLTRML